MKSKSLFFVIFLTIFIGLQGEFIDNNKFFYEKESQRNPYINGIYKEFFSKDSVYRGIDIHFNWESFLIYNSLPEIKIRDYLSIEGKFNKVSFYILPTILYMNNYSSNYFSGMVKWKYVFADFREAYMNFQLNDNINLTVGKKRVIQGSGIYDRALFSGYTTPMDLIGGTFAYGNLMFNWFTAQLSSRDSLYLSSHSIKYLKKYYGITFSEVIMYHRKQPELYYLNPFSLYYVVQYNRRGAYNDNILWDIDIFFYPYRNAYIYGELLIDDFQYDPKTPGPAKLAFVSGAEIFYKRGSAIVEFSRVNRWTYTHFIDDQIWVYNKIPIGSSLGIDAWKIRLSQRYALNRRLLLNYDIYYKEKGEGKFTDDISLIDSFPGGFPSGVVYKEGKISIGCVRRIPGGFSSFSLFLIRRENKNNIISSPEYDKGIKWSMEWSI